MYHHFEKLLSSICYSIDTGQLMLDLLQHLYLDIVTKHFLFTKVVCLENLKGVSVMHRLLVAEDMLMNLEQQ